MVFFKIILLFTLLKANDNFTPYLSKLPFYQIRFQTKDGKVLFYQKENGILVLSKNYSTKDFIRKNKDDYIFIKPSFSGKYLLFYIYNNFSTQSGHLPLYEVYISEFDGNKLKKIGNYNNALISSDENWIITYVENEKLITISNIYDDKVNYKINLKNNKIHSLPLNFNADFLSNADLIINTINETGLTEIKVWNKSLQKLSSVQTSNQSLSSFVTCPRGNQTYLIISTKENVDISLFNNNKKLLESVSLLPLIKAKVECDFKQILISHELKEGTTLARLDLEKKTTSVIYQSNYYFDFIIQSEQLFIIQDGEILIPKDQQKTDEELK